jgi:hypothetical protein
MRLPMAALAWNRNPRQRSKWVGRRELRSLLASMATLLAAPATAPVITLLP